jgi:predicted Zn-dependent protease
VRHAHYYLAMLAVSVEGVLRVDDAIAEFQKELALAPEDPFMNERLGMALVEAHREREALPHLRIATRGAEASPLAFQYLGRAQLALDQAGDAVISLRRALAASAGVKDAQQLSALHYQLARALRQAGSTAEADAEFAAAQQLSAAHVETARDQLARFMRDEEGADTDAGMTGMMPLNPGPLAEVSAAARRELAGRVSTMLARTYLNLGVMQARAERFGRAAELFEQAAAIDPEFPQLQYSLGVACFNAQQYAKAAAALTRAATADPGNADVRRMLALAALNTDDFARAADLLRNDPQRDADPSLQFAYGIALVRSGHAADAESTFSRLIAAHGDSPELNVVLGQAHAEQGDYEAAVKSLERAIALKADVAEANASLGIIYLKQGRLADAVARLQAELAAHPADVKARYTLATALDLDGRPEDALRELRAVLKARPEYADARYLHGKILLARGLAADAVDELEIAARLAPDDANVHYQLGQAYQKLGRVEQAQQQFDVFQKLKDKRRGGSR